MGCRGRASFRPGQTDHGERGKRPVRAGLLVAARQGPMPADARGAWRSPRSSPRAGKPSAWRRRTAGPRREKSFGRSGVNTSAPMPVHVAEQRVLGWQTKLHRWAVQDEQQRFGDLFNLVCDPATLLVAWERVKRNRGSRTAGVDGQTRKQIEQMGVDGVLATLREELKAGTYRPLPARERVIPKRSGKLRSLGISTVRDRIVQTAAKLVLEPIFGKRRTTGMREGNGRVLHRRPSESRWPRVMRWRPARAQRSVHRGARRPVIEPRNGSDIGVPTRSKTSEGNTVGGVFASRQRTPRGLRTRHVCDLSMLRTGRSHGHPPVVMEGRVVRGRPRP